MTAIRLTFDVVGGKPTYRSATRLTMRVPPQQKIANLGQGTGLWLELRDAKGKALYCRVIDSETLRADTELRTGAADRPLVRSPSKAIAAVFNAVIPDDPQGKTFHIFERRAGAKDKAPAELVRVAIKDI